MSVQNVYWVSGDTHPNVHTPKRIFELLLVLLINYWFMQKQQQDFSPLRWLLSPSWTISLPGKEKEKNQERLKGNTPLWKETSSLLQWDTLLSTWACFISILNGCSQDTYERNTDCTFLSANKPLFWIWKCLFSKSGCCPSRCSSQKMSQSSISALS